MESFHSKSEALAYIESGIVRGQYQNCGRLTVIDSLNIMHGKRHHPRCEADSLGRERGYRDSGATYCPEGCHYFISKAEFQAEQEVLEQKNRWKARRQAFGRLVKTVITGPFVWFQKLPAIVQTLIILLVIISLFPQFKQTIFEILKALGRGTD